MQQAEEAAKSIHKAMKGMGTDESRIIKEVVTHSNAQRQLIKQQYLTMYGHTLEEDLKSEIGGYFLESTLALFTQTDEYEAKCLKDAIKGVGTDEQVCIQILCSKETNEIATLKATYRRLFDRDLGKELENEEGGPLGRMFRSLGNGARSDSRAVDQALAHKEAQELYDAGQGKIGTDEEEYVRILCSRSFPQLRATFEEYFIIGDKDIEKAIKKETSGNFEDACMAIIKCVRNRPEYFAEQMQNAMKGVGTKDSDLLRLLVLRSEIDLQAIKKEYKRLYNKSLYDAVKGELNGDFEKLFLALIGKD